MHTSETSSFTTAIVFTNIQLCRKTYNHTHAIAMLRERREPILNEFNVNDMNEEEEEVSAQLYCKIDMYRQPKNMILQHSLVV